MLFGFTNCQGEDRQARTLASFLIPNLLTRRQPSIDLCNKVRNGLVQVLAVYRPIQLSEEIFAEAQVPCFDDKLHFRPVVVDRLETMIVVNGKPKELADPLPVAPWDKLGHGKPSL